MKKFIKNVKKLILRYILTEKHSPEVNRQKVAQNLMILTILIFFILMINFAVIIGTDRKFGVDLSKGAKQVHQTQRLIQAKRGTIYDRNGRAIAQDAITYTIYAIIDKNYKTKKIDKKTNEEIEDNLYIEPSEYETVAEIFERYLGIDRDYTIKQLKQDLSQTYFGVQGSNIPYSTMKAMKDEFEAMQSEDNNISKGIGFSSTPNRMYPNGTFASHFIGLALPQENKDGSRSLVGTTGLEASLNSILAGQDGIVTYQKDRKGLIQFGTEEVEREAIDGKDVYTTLSAPLQINLEIAMTAFQNLAQGRFASATLLNAKTGEILATTQRPTLNADTKEELNDENFSWNTLLYQGHAEPGSTLKIMTVASAIDAGVFNPNEAYFNDKLTIADATIKDWKVNKGLSEGEYLTMAKALPFSSNIGMAMLQQKIGTEKWIKILEKFRIGLPTRFGLNGESSGIFPEENIVTYAMSAFGHGISLTQVQLFRVFTAIATDGSMMEPQFISKIYDPNTDTSRVSQPEVIAKPVSQMAAEQTRQYMVEVGTDPYYGTLYTPETGPVIQVGNYAVAVKSGTAQIAGANGQGYLQGANDYIYSVVAMVPAEDPQFIMYATLQQPVEEWTGLLWQQLINPILSEAMLMQDSLIEPVASGQTTPYLLPALKGKNPGETAAELRRNLVHPIIIGNGNKISKTSSKPGSDIKPGQQLLLLTNKVDTLPDMYGWTKENVEAFAKWQGIEITFKGKGQVVKQNKESGTPLEKAKKVTITLEETN